MARCFDAYLRDTRIWTRTGGSLAGKEAAKPAIIPAPEMGGEGSTGKMYDFLSGVGRDHLGHDAAMTAFRVAFEAQKADTGLTS